MKQLIESAITQSRHPRINLYIARINRLAARRRFYDAVWDAVTMVVVSYLSILFAYFLFGGDMRFANKDGLFQNCSQTVRGVI